jgi:hypothetical protein
MVPRWWTVFLNRRPSGGTMAQLEAPVKMLPGKCSSVYLPVAPYLPSSPRAPPKAFAPARMRQVPLSLAAMPVRLLYLPAPLPPIFPV